MNKTSCRTLPILCVALVVTFLVAMSGAAAAQDVYKLTYFANSIATTPGAPDATARIANPGLYSGDPICAMVYVYDWDQQLSECCGCTITHDGLRTLSVNVDLLSYPLTGVFSNNGTIHVVSAKPNVGGFGCDASSSFGLAANVRAWATHVQNAVAGAYPITETAFDDSVLSSGEITRDIVGCHFIKVLGSGRGVCSCGSGG